MQFCNSLLELERSPAPVISGEGRYHVPFPRDVGDVLESWLQKLHQAVPQRRLEAD